MNKCKKKYKVLVSFNILNIKIINIDKSETCINSKKRHLTDSTKS
jgi:hypothetical protein